MRKLLCLFAVLLLAACSSQTDMRSILPDIIGKYELKETVHNEQALLQINKLHGKAIEALDGVVGTYEGPGRPMRVWVSRATDDKEARRQLGEMVHLMYENPKSPFSWQKRMNFRHVPVYPFTGMEQVHLVFHQGDLVYWLSVNQGQEEEALAAFIQE